MGKRRSWADLPRDILGFILGKSEDAVDVIRFRAVCKNWRNVDIPKDTKIIKHGNLPPWLCNLSWWKDGLKCEMQDPYSGQIFVTRKYVKSDRYMRFYSNSIRCFGSNEGWLIAGYPSFDFRKWAIFIYNPYTQDFISLPRLKYCPLFATFSGNRVFVFSCKEIGPGYKNYIASYCLNDSMKKKWRIESVGETQVKCRGMQFVKKQEQLLCLFSDGTMRKYCLSSSSQGAFALVSLGEGSHRLAECNQRLWLAKGYGDLLVACELDCGGEWSTFYFDWSNMSWMASNLQVSSAFFITIDQPTFVGSFSDYDRKVYLLNELVRKKEHSKYFFEEPGNVKGIYDLATLFIEPPRISLAG